MKHPAKQYYCLGLLVLLVFGGLTAYAHRVATSTHGKNPNLPWLAAFTTVFSSNSSKVLVDKGAPAVAIEPKRESLPIGVLGANPITRSAAIETQPDPPMEPAQSGGGFNLTQSVVSGGGGTSAGGNLTLSGSVGQTATGVSTGGSLSLSGGFWSGSGVCQPISILPTTLPQGRAGDAYSELLTATGGTGAYVFNLSVGALPAGLTLTTGGLLSGTPTAFGIFNFTVQATDATTCAGRQSYTLAVSPACGTITITPGTLPNGFAGTPYSQTLTGNGGAAPYTFTVSAGVLPGGLTLSSAGAVSGTPAVNGSFNFTVRARDANNCEGTQAYLLTVNRTDGRTVRVAPSSGAPGSTVPVHIELDSQGDENALGSSISFDPNVLSNPRPVLGSDASGAIPNFNLSQAASGRVGLSLALSTGQAFAAGARRVFTVTFTIAAGATASSTNINFGDQPIAREVVSATATTLTASYLAGTVTITRGLEGDVSPRPEGSGAVTISDWVQVGRFAAGIDTAADGSEFQRADCAPRECGNGAITISDWVQAGRYAAGLDAAVAACGPTAPTVAWLPENDEPLANLTQQTRSIRALAAVSSPNAVTLTIISRGNENALGFSLQFNPAQWRFVAATGGNDAPDALLNTNTSQTARGRLGVALALPANRTFAAGARQFAVLTFEPVAGSSAPALVLSFADAPVSREVVAADAQTLAASYAVELGGNSLSLLTSLSAASYRDGDSAREQILAAFGANLATQIAVAETLPLPTELAGTRVVVSDSQGAMRNAPLFFASPMQINYLMPAGTADGGATVTVMPNGGAVSVGVVFVSLAAPGLFTADASGTGLPAATLLRVNGAGMLSYEPIARFDPITNRIVAVPISFGAAEDQVFLILFGTGVRGRSSLSGVSCTVGSVAAEVSYAGEAAGFAGLDQLNVQLPRQLTGRGDVDLILRVDGKVANVVRVNIR